MSFINIAYLTMVIAGFLAFAISLFWVYVYTNAKPRQAAAPKAVPERTPEPEGMRRAA